MHRAASPFVEVKYAQKWIYEQCQLSWKQIKMPAFYILSGLPLKMGDLTRPGRRKGDAGPVMRRCRRSVLSSWLRRATLLVMPPFPTYQNE